MSVLRPATAVETAGLWPAVRSTRIFASQEEFAAFRDAGPWRVRVTESGEALIVAPWRSHSDLLAIRGLWAASTRIPALLGDAGSVARAQGFKRLVSPLLTRKAYVDYERGGMRIHERIVALQGFAADIAHAVTEGTVIRRAAAEDLEQLERLDQECFDEFWRYGPAEFTESLSRERMTVAVDANAELIGYATCSLHGASSTVGRLAVAPAVRRRGVGRALLGDAAAWASRQQAYALTLCTQEDNDASRRLYASVGLFELNEPYVIGIRDV